MRTAVRSSALALAALTASCAPAVVPRATLPAPTIAPSLDVDAMTPVRFFALTQDIPGPHRVDARRVTWGGHRAEVDGTSVLRVAEEPLSGTIIAAVPTGNEWIFVDQHGDASRSTGFLGEATPLGRIAPSFELACRGRADRVACVADGALWITDGSAPIAPAPEHHRGAVLSAAFLDARFGAAVFEGGVLALTRDGGNSWQTQELPDGRAAKEIGILGDELEVKTSRGWYGIHPDLPLTRRAPDIDRSNPGHRVAALKAPLLAVLAHRFPALWERLTFTRPFQRRDDGTFVAIDLSARTATRHERTHGAALPGATNRARFADHLDLQPWGAGLALFNDNELFRAREREGLDFQHVSFVTRAEGCTFAFSSNGVSAASLGPCQGEPALHTLVIDRHQFVPLDLPREDTPRFLIGMHNSHVLGVRCTGRSGGEPPCHPRVIDTLEHRRVALTLDGAPMPESLEGTLARDGTLTMVLDQRQGASHRTAAVGPIETGALREVDLPDGVLTARFFDPRRGLAIGEQWGQLYRTRDGGSHWERVQIPPSIVAPSTPIHNGTYIRASWTGPIANTLDCDAHRCTLLGRVAMTGWGPLPEPDDARENTERAPRALPRVPSTQGASLGCVYRIENDGRQPPPPPPYYERGLPREERAPRAWSVVERAGANALRFRWQIERVNSAPLRRTVTWQPAAGALPEPEADHRDAGSARWDLRGVTDGGILFERCAGGTDCTLLFVGARGAPVVLRTPPDDEDPTPRGEVLDALALPNGDVIVRAQSELESERVSVFAPDGRLRWHRDFTFDREHSRRAYSTGGLRGLALRAGVPGFVNETVPRGTLLFFPLTGPSADAVPVERSTESRVLPCEGDPSPQLLTVRLAEYGRSPTLSLSYELAGGGMGGRGSTSEPRVRAEYELDPSQPRARVCVRSIERPEEPNEGHPVALGYAGAVLRWSRAGLAGRYINALGTYPLRCGRE